MTAEQRIKGINAATDERMLAFHKLWTKAVGTPGYDKREWQDMERQLIALIRAEQALEETSDNGSDAPGPAEPNVASGALFLPTQTRITCEHCGAPVTTSEDATDVVCPRCERPCAPPYARKGGLS